MDGINGNFKIIDSLKQLVRESSNNLITFKDFMELCLYHETAGYYRNENLKIGRDGDFYTSSSIGTIMGEMIGNFIMRSADELLEGNEILHVVEWGGGNGRLALHALDEIVRLDPKLYERLDWYMIETSNYHQELQRETLKMHIDKVIWMDAGQWFSKQDQIVTIVVANELLDAFSVHRIRSDQGVIVENWVGWDDDQGRVIEKWLPLDDVAIETYLLKNGIQLLDGQVAEINLAASSWVEGIVSHFKQGKLLVIDYGDRADELFSPHRMKGTLMCYRKHQAHDNPYIYLGEQDITAHVDFSSCMRVATESGCASVTLQTQREFLVVQGILERLQETANRDPFSEQARRNRSIRQLLLSDGMSELFKVMIVSKYQAETVS
ncbi:class I SAM-dependent methyltransferase [Paenibacillus sp. KN14-4R]|uniref:class I SAM-dependent methyltransferase n=1 Tax=Paenibacillus sp. KN14-4R TaxID=3445773 RepID=UPI003F9FCDCC